MSLDIVQRSATKPEYFTKQRNRALQGHIRKFIRFELDHLYDGQSHAPFAIHTSDHFRSDPEFRHFGSRGEGGAKTSVEQHNHAAVKSVLPKVVKDKFNHNGAHFNSTNGEGRQTAISLTLSEAPKHGEKKGERLPKKIANELQHALLADLEDELDGIAENIHVEYRLSGNVKKVGMDYHSGEELEAEYNLATYIITFEFQCRS